MEGCLSGRKSCTRNAVKQQCFRGFKSLSFRQEEPHSNSRFFYFCHNGVAGIVFPTKKVEPKPTTNYLWLKRDYHGNWVKTKTEK